MAQIKMSRLCFTVIVILGTILGAKSSPVKVQDDSDDAGTEHDDIYPSIDGDQDDSTTIDRVSQYLRNVLDQVRAGHVTQARVNDWKNRFNHDLQTGSLSQSKYHQFLQQVKSELMSQSTNSRYCSACLFWVG